MMLGACATSSSLERQLPAAPDYAVPAVVPEPQENEACVSVAGRERAGRLTNAEIIGAVVGDWNAMAATYAGKTPVSLAPPANKGAGQ